MFVRKIPHQALGKASKIGRPVREIPHHRLHLDRDPPRHRRHPKRKHQHQLRLARRTGNAMRGLSISATRASKPNRPAPKVARRSPFRKLRRRRLPLAGSRPPVTAGGRNPLRLGYAGKGQSYGGYARYGSKLMKGEIRSSMPPRARAAGGWEGLERAGSDRWPNGGNGGDSGCRAAGVPIR